MSFRLGVLATELGCRLEGDAELRIDGIQTLEVAGPRDLSFLTNRKYRSQAKASRAGALLVPEGVELEGRHLLISEHPYAVLADAVRLFFPAPPRRSGVHPSAIVDEGAEVDPSAYVGPLAVIEEGARVEEGAQVGAQVFVGRDCRVGRSSWLYPQVVLYEGTQIGERCIVHGGTVIGSDGFGFATVGGEHRKLPQVGSVIVEDDVEIGANCTLDRATLGETRVGAGSKLDNLVHLAHNVTLGRGCLMAGQSGIAGSTRVGDFVVVAGQSGISGHLKVGDQVVVASKSAVVKSVEKGIVAGTPAVEAGRWRRQTALIGRLEELHKRVRELEKARDEKEEDDE